MGQGLYTMLGVGVLNPPWSDDDDTDDALTNALLDLGLHCSYEAAPMSLVLPLAVDDEVLQTHWKLPPLPDMLPHPKPRTACVLDGPMTPQPAELATWKQAQALYTAAGLMLGEPGMIVLNDWD